MAGERLAAGTEIAAVSCRVAGTSFDTNQGWTVRFDIQGSWDGSTTALYDIFACTNLVGGSLTNSQWVWLERGPTCSTYQYTNQPDAQTFYILGTPLDSDNDGLTDATEILAAKSDPNNPDTDGDGLPDGWEWNNFGNFLQTAGGDYDGDFVDNGTEYTNHTDPNTITFDSRFAKLYVNSRTVTGTCDVHQGHPAFLALLVDSTNLATASWRSYTSSNFSVTLPDSDGDHILLVALRGRTTNFPSVWDETEITLDRVPPTLVITNPVTATVAKPYLQLQGYGNEPLVSLSYDLTNALGLVTNEAVSVVDQEFETNRFDFTTNYFQGFDIPLTDGENTITLRASDRAGNVTVITTNIVLTYTNAAPLVMQFIWPTNGMYLSGESFYIRGMISDETASLKAQLVDTNGATNEIAGIVERNGMFWVEGVPLNAGTNTLTLIAQDAAGNLNSTNLSVVKSTVALTIDSTPEGAALYRTSDDTPRVVSGTVSDTNYSVTVNGVAATLDGTNWTAVGVPILGCGTATFDAVANVSGGGGSVSAQTSVEIEMPPAIIPTKHFVNQRIESTFSRSGWTKSYEASLSPGADGRWRQKYQGNATSFYSDYDGGWFADTTEYAWSDTNVVGTYHAAHSSSESSGPIPESDWLVKTVPDQQYDHSTHGTDGETIYYVYQFFGKGVKRQWVYDSGLTTTVFLSARTQLTLYTGGKSVLGEKIVFWLSAVAGEYLKPSQPAWFLTPGSPIPYEQIEMAGKPLSVDGERLVQYAANTVTDVSPKFDYKQANALTFMARGKFALECEATTPANRTKRLTLGVGERVNLSWNPSPGRFPDYYTCTSGSVKNYEDQVWRFTAPSNAASSTVTAHWLDSQNQEIAKHDVCTFTVIEPSGIKATIRTNENFGSGNVGAGMFMNVVVQPTTVSFYRLQVIEPTATATGKQGYFESHAPPDHGTAQGAGAWHSLNSANLIQGPPVDPFDHAWSGGWPANESGAYTWPIHPYWRIANDSKSNALSGWTDQVHTLVNGTMTVTKLGNSVSRSPRDP